jgi:hypothetical protein
MKKYFLGLMLLLVLALPMVASAQNLENQLWGNKQDQVANALGMPANSDIRVTIAKIINVALGLLGIVCVVIIIAGGVMWMTSGGEAAKTEKARGIIFAGIIGLAIILSAYAIANFVISNLTSAVANQ